MKYKEIGPGLRVYSDVIGDFENRWGDGTDINKYTKIRALKIVQEVVGVM